MNPSPKPSAEALAAHTPSAEAVAAAKERFKARKRAAAKRRYDKIKSDPVALAKYRSRKNKYDVWRRMLGLKPNTRSKVKNKPSLNAWARSYNKKPENRPKQRARNAVFRALQTGLLTKKPCEKCGDIKVQAHHADYSKRLEVTWLCMKHHIEEHGRTAVRLPTC